METIEQEMELNVRIRGSTRRVVVDALGQVFEMVSGGVDVTTIQNDEKKYESTMELIPVEMLEELESDGFPFPVQEGTFG